jgi:hypothetical protein
MIINIDNGAIWDNKDADIIFNPVSALQSVYHSNEFNDSLRSKYPETYNQYLCYMIGKSHKRLLGDINIAASKNGKLILNGYCKDYSIINLLALVDSLIRLYNIANEYEFNIAIPKRMYCINKNIVNSIDLIIHTIFDDFPYNVYLYDK